MPHGYESVYERGARGWDTFITHEQIDSVGPKDVNLFLETLPPSEIQAIEVYTSSVNIPAEFASGGSPCAVIAIWRKHGP